MPPCVVENMAPLTDTVIFRFACLTLSINPSISTGEPSLCSPGAHTNKEWKSYASDKRLCQGGSYNASLWNSNTTRSMLGVLRNSGPKLHRGIVVKKGD